MARKPSRQILDELVAKHGAPPPELRVFDHAKQFHVVGARSLMFEEPEPGEPIIFPGPGAVCLAFAAELYLKALYTLEAGASGHGHRLNVLFARLSPAAQRSIEARYLVRTCRDGPRLRGDLVTWANSFVDWRYVFERTEHMHLDTGALNALASTLYDAAIALRPAWKAEGYTAKFLTSGYVRLGT